MATEGKRNPRKQIFFNGQWLPSVDPLGVGAKNYTDIQNWRYGQTGLLEGVAGYSKINATPHPSYVKGRSGIQLRSPFGVLSRTLVQALTFDESSSAIIQTIAHTASEDIPNPKDFETTPLYVDDADAGLGRFSKWPNNQIAYCNGKTSQIYGGDEIPPAAFITSSAAVTSALTNPQNFTIAVRNALQTTGNYAAIAAGALVFLVGSTRKLSGIKPYIKTYNAGAASITCKEWTGAAWSALVITDNTNGLTEDGTITWPSTVSTSVLKLLENRLLYWYQFTLSAGSAEIYQLTVDAPFQPVLDVWDGALRPVIQCRHYHAGAWIDDTMAVLESTDGIATAASGEVASVGGLTSAEYIDVGLSERTCALNIIMYAKETGKINTNASILSVEYWTGSAYAAVSGFVDLTDVSGKTLAQRGFVSWTPPAFGVEMQKNQFGLTLWYYRIKVSATLSADVWIDQIQAIPAPQLNALGYKFPFVYQDRPMLCNLTSTNEGNRVDFPMAGSTESWNGDDSSLGDGKAPLFFPGPEELTCAAEVYNRLGSSIYTFGIFLKAHATQLLHGIDTATYTIYPISDTIGCPAPLTLDTCQVSESQEAMSARSIAAWLSYAGPYMFDAGGLTPIPGLECYFDPSDSRRISFEKIARAVGWFDPDYPEYNLILPINNDAVVSPLAIQTFDDATLSGTPVVIRFSAGGLYHYVVAYPTISAVEGGTGDDALTSPYTLGAGAVSGSMHTLETVSDGTPYYFEAYPAAASSLLYDGATNTVPAYTPSALSGIPRIAKTIVNGVPYYFKMYPAKQASSLIDFFDSQLWVVYNMTLKRWFQKVPSGSFYTYPQAGFRVADAVNKQYAIGCRNDGFLMRLEDGTTWDGDDIVQSVATGEFLPTESIFDLVRIKRVKLVCVAMAEVQTMAIEHYADGATLPTTLAPVALSDDNRHVRKTQPVNLDAWTHKLRFTTHTNATAKGVRPLVWGYEDEILRDDVH